MSIQISRIRQQIMAPFDKDKRVKNKEIKGIEAEVKKVAGEVIELEGDLARARFGLVSGDGVHVTALTKIGNQIAEKQKQLRIAEAKLSSLLSHKKSGVLANQIFENKRKLESLEKGTAVLQAYQPTLGKVYQLKKEINEHLEIAAKKPGIAGAEFVKAIRKYREFEQLKESQPEDLAKKIETELGALRVKMTVIAEKTLLLKKSEKKLILKNESKKSIPPKELVKLREALMKLAVKELFFSSKGEDPERKNRVNRWLTGFGIQKDVPRTKELCGDEANTGLMYLSREYMTKDNLTLKEEPPRRAERTKGTFADQQLARTIDKQKVVKSKRRFNIGLFDKLRNKRAIKIADDAKAIGIKCLKTMKFIDQRLVDLSISGKGWSDIEVVKGEIDQFIRTSETELNELQMSAASLGYRRLGAEIEKVITVQRNLLDSLRETRGVLETYTQEPYQKAVKHQNDITACVKRALKDEKGAGFEIFKAQNSLDELRRMVQKAPAGSPLLEELNHMVEVAEKAIKSAYDQGTLHLTRDKGKLRQRMLRAYKLKDFAKITRSKEIARRLAIILSKEMTEALYFLPEEEREGKLQEITSMHQLILHHSPILWEEMLGIEGMTDLYKKFDGEIPGNEDRKEAISYGNEIKEFLLRIAKEKEEAGRMIFPALDRLAKLQGVCERCEDSKQKESLVSLHKELEARVKQEAPQALNLTKHKQKLRDQILNSKMTRAHTPERVALILTKEITMAFLDRGAMQNSKVGAMVENLKRNTDLWDILKKDEQLQYMIEQYQLMKPLSNESMLLDFYLKPWSNFSLGVLELEQRGPGEQQAILDNLKKKASNAKENLQRSLTEADVLFRKTEDTINQRRAPTALSEIVRCELSGLEEKIKFVDSCFKGGVEGLKRSQEYVRTNLATPDDFLKTAQGIYIVPFNEYDLRNPPSSAGVERLRKEYDLLVKRDPENAENWKKLASLTEEYVVAFEKYGEIFKDAYSKDAVSQKYYPSMDYTMNASQKEALRILRQANEKALGEVQALSFTPSEFIGVQKMHKEQYLQMLKFRQRLLSELENPSTYEKPS